MLKASIGIIGLGVMGRSLAKNIAGKGISVSVFNRTTPAEQEVVANFLKENTEKHIQGHTALENFVNSMSGPRKILLMVSAGYAVDAVIEQLSPLLSPGDVLIDGGNSHYRDTQRRELALKRDQIHFLGVGISGGEEGALKGPSIMAGGAKDAYTAVRPIFEAIAARDRNNQPCVSLMGPDGSGHFVKTLHNGMEYVEMQLLAECYALLVPTRSHDEIAARFQEWNKGWLSSFLLEITIDILKKKEGDAYLLDLILDMADSKGTGTWSSQAAYELGVPATMIHTAVNARFISMLKEKRKQYSSLSARPSASSEIQSETLRKAFAMARIINLHQGFEVIKAASRQNGWGLDLSEVARIWTEGCIIKSEFMEILANRLKQEDDLFLIPEFTDGIASEEELKEVVMYALKSGVSTVCISNSLQYWLSITSESSAANIIQAQRDYFGAHTYKRTDKPFFENFTTNWKSDG